LLVFATSVLIVKLFLFPPSSLFLGIFSHRSGLSPDLRGELFPALAASPPYLSEDQVVAGPPSSCTLPASFSGPSLIGTGPYFFWPSRGVVFQSGSSPEAVK